MQKDTHIDEAVVIDVEYDNDFAVIMNAINDNVSVKAAGSWFSFKPGQKKRFTNKAVAQKVAENGKDLGLVELPPQVADPSWAVSTEGKAIVAQKKAEGMANRVAHLNSIVHNLTVSLQQDLDKANIKASPLTYASKGEIAAMKELDALSEQKSVEQNAASEELLKLATKLKEKKAIN